jgi:excisionase family DNA binding protein
MPSIDRNRRPPRGEPLMPTDQVMTVDEVAAYLKVHESTIYRLLKAHDIPGFRIGSDWRFLLKEIDAWRLSRSGAVRQLEEPK